LVGLVAGFRDGLFGTIYPILDIQPQATSFITPSFLRYIRAELWISVALLTLPAQLVSATRWLSSVSKTLPDKMFQQSDGFLLHCQHNPTVCYCCVNP